MYRATVSFTTQDMLAYIRFQRRYKQRAAYVFYLFINIMIPVLLLALVYVYWLGRDKELLRYGALMLVLGVLYQFVDRITAGSMLKAQKNMDNVNYLFGEERLEARAAAVESNYPYDSFQELYYSGKNRCYYLFINNRTALLLPERCFTEGDPAAFRFFIESKTGRQIKDVK